MHSKIDQLHKHLFQAIPHNGHCVHQGEDAVGHRSQIASHHQQVGSNAVQPSKPVTRASGVQPETVHEDVPVVDGCNGRVEEAAPIEPRQEATVHGLVGKVWRGVEARDIRVVPVANNALRQRAEAFDDRDAANGVHIKVKGGVGGGCPGVENLNNGLLNGAAPQVNGRGVWGANVGVGQRREHVEHHNVHIDGHCKGYFNGVHRDAGQGSGSAEDAGKVEAPWNKGVPAALQGTFNGRIDALKELTPKPSCDCKVGTACRSC